MDGFTCADDEVPVDQRPEIDRWIISLLNSLVKNVLEQYENYEPTKAARMIQDFVIENLSNTGEVISAWINSRHTRPF